jgi:hypothetical protein
VFIPTRLGVQNIALTLDAIRRRLLGDCISFEIVGVEKRQLRKQLAEVEFADVQRCV